MYGTLIVIFISALVIFLFGLTTGKKSLKNIFYFWLLCFAFGPRGREFLGVQFMYLEGITWLCFFFMILRINVFFPDFKKIFPKYSFFLILWIIFISFCTVNLYNRDWRVAITEAKVYFVIIPVFYLCFISFKYLEVKLKNIVTLLFFGVTFLVLGAFFPSLFGFLPQDFFGPNSLMVASGSLGVGVGDGLVLEMKGGSFWGLMLSAYLILVIFPIFTQSEYTKSLFNKYFYKVICLAMLIVVVWNGKRSAWSGFLIGLAFFLWMKGFRKSFWIILFVFCGLFFIPKEVIARFETIFKTSEQSWARRHELNAYAFNLIKQHPITGAGFGAAGWTHNFALQFGANTGITGLSIFFLWISNLYFRSFSSYNSSFKRTDIGIYLIAFLASVLAFWGPLLGEMTINAPDLMIPFWFFCAILQNFNNGNITKEVKSENKEIG